MSGKRGRPPIPPHKQKKQIVIYITPRAHESYLQIPRWRRGERISRFLERIDHSLDESMEDLDSHGHKKAIAKRPPRPKPIPKAEPKPNKIPNLEEMGECERAYFESLNQPEENNGEPNE